jgi:hypothetical protein
LQLPGVLLTGEAPEWRQVAPAPQREGNRCEKALLPSGARPSHDASFA